MVAKCDPHPSSDILLNLEAMAPDKPFEKVLESCLPLLQRQLLPNPESTSEHLPTLLRTLAIRYSGYVRETFGTRLSPHLSHAFREQANMEPEEKDALNESDQEESKADSNKKKKYEDEASEQACFLGRVTAIAILLANEHPGDGNRGEGNSSKEDQSSIGFHRPSLLDISSIPRPTLDNGTAVWAGLWIRLVVMDMIGCGPLLRMMLEKEEFSKGFRGVFERKDKDFQEKSDEAPPASADADVPSITKERVVELRNRLFTLQEALFPPRSGHKPWFPMLPDPPWASKDDGTENAEGTEDQWSAGVLRSWLDELTASWLYILTALDVELLRHRHLFGSSEIPNELSKLWSQTGDTLHGWMWARRNAAPNARDSSRRELIRFILAGRPASTGPGQPQNGEDQQSSKDGWCHNHLSIDSLWLQMYLLEAITRQMSLDEVTRNHFPDRHLTVAFLKRFAGLTIHLLWTLLREELDPAALPLPCLPCGNRTRENRESEPDPCGEPPPEAGGDSGQNIREVGKQRLVFGRGLAPVGMDEYTDALIEMVDIYAHHVIELPFEIHVGRFLRWFLDSQGLLFLVKAHYRDHLYHVIDVFLLGDFLLGCRLGRERSRLQDVLETLLERAPKTSGGDVDSVVCSGVHLDLRKNWCVAGLFHDLGYPMLLHRELSRAEPTALVGETLQGFVRHMHEALKGGADELEKRIREAFSEFDEKDPGVASDHGVLSAMMIRDHMRRIQWPAAERQLIEEFEPALTAIYLHNLQDRVVRIQDAPLTYLLAFCDEVQDWGRRRVDQQVVSRDVTWAVTEPTNWQLRSVPVLGDLRLVVEGVSGHDVVLPGPYGETVPPGGRRGGPSAVRAGDEVVIELYQVYRPASPELLDPLFLWISKAQNLERLDARDAPWRPRLVLITAVPRKLQRMELTYLELLSRIADRAEELNLRRFVHHLIRLRREAQAASGEGGASPPLPTISEEVLKLDGHEWDWVVLDQRRLAEDLPLRSFGTTAGAGRLLEVEQQIIREAWERYRYQGRGLWPLATDQK